MVIVYFVLSPIYSIFNIFQTETFLDEMNMYTYYSFIYKYYKYYYKYYKYLN